jgi:hypothetical protein
VIESRLSARLADCVQGDRHIIPLVVDLKGCGTESECSVYAGGARLLYRALRRNRTVALDLSKTLLHTIVADHEEVLSFYRFEDVLDDLATHVEQQSGPLRLVFLLDEVEATTRFTWSETLFNQLRALIYDAPLAEVVRLVLTGSTQVTRVHHEGSPLLNAVKIVHLESFSEVDLRNLISRGGKVANEVSSAVQVQSAGHPFIAQYLLHHLWDDGLAEATLAHVERVAHQMRQQRAADLQGWWEAIGDSGQQAYAVLSAEQDWMDERALIAKVQNTARPLGQGLAALCYHGLAVRDASRQRYRVAGKLFFDWFALNGAGRLAETAMQPDRVQVIVEHLEQYIGSQTTIGGDVKGTVASGQFESAVAIGGGEAVDLRGSQGALHKPTGPVDQQFGNRTVVHTTGDVVFSSQPDGSLDLAPSPEATQLHRILVDRMDLEEFRTLCFDLGASYDSLGGEGLSGKARQLVLFLQKREALPRLVEWLRRERPDIRNV